MSFAVGQKIVCVRTWINQPADYPWMTFPIEGQIYTVRSFCKAHPRGILLQEIHHDRPVRFRGGIWSEPSFAIQFFRPLIERKTSIEFAHEILRSATVKEPA